MDDDKLKKLERLKSALLQERSSFESYWRTLGDFILPTRPRFLLTDANRGERKSQKIIDITATLAARTLKSGMMGGITSPARPWFRLTVPDPDLSEFGPVKEWLHIVTKRMETIFLRSNLYNILSTSYGDLGVFGTSGIFIEEDFEDVLRFYSLPIGSFAFGLDDRLKSNKLVREFTMTIEQLVDRFGKMDKNGLPNWSNFSIQAKQFWDDGNKDQRINVTHIVLPNAYFDDSKLNPKFKKWRSVYYESGASEDNKFLSESGFNQFPFLLSRWDVTSEDVYGTSCPGMEALGDIKQIQLMHKRKAQVLELQVKPPMTAPTFLKTRKASIIAGDVTYLDTREGQGSFQPAFQVDPRIEGVTVEIKEIQGRIKQAFYEDMFLMLAYSDRRQITAREIDERHEEKIFTIGPMLERLNDDQNDPLIDKTFNVMVKRGMIPIPPEEIQGMKLKVEYLSIMAQALKLLGISNLERFTGFIGNIVSQTQSLEILDKVDIDQIVDECGDALSVPPHIIRPDDKVEEIRAGRVQAVKAQQAIEIIQSGAKTTKDLSQADMGGENALTALLKQTKAGEAVPT